MRIVFIGTGGIGVPTLKALLRSEHAVVGVVTQPDKPSGRDQKITAPPIKQTVTTGDPAEKAAPGKPPLLDVLQPARIKDPKAIEAIRALTPDVIVVVAYGQILPRDALEIPRIACLNLHASLLPRWRGAAPIQAAIAAGDRETGITVMYMDEGLDTGDILLQVGIGISPDETGGSLHDRLAQIAPGLLLESLGLLARGNALRIPQDHSLATIAPKLTREAGRIDWKQSAVAIERKIRAYNPWPGAFATVRDPQTRELRLKVFRADVIDGTGRPGEVLCADHRGLIVATGEQALSFQQVQVEGKSRMSGADFIRGHSWLLARELN